MSKKIFFIAGETSGDIIGSKIMRHISKEIDVSMGVGGKNMLEAGMKSLFDIKDTSIMGFFEIIKQIPLIIKRINQTIDYVIKYDPDVIVTIDSPGFVKRIVKKLRESGYKKPIIHIVAPTVWAYKEKRAEYFAKYFDAICCFFPFEPKYFEKHGLKSYFVGNISIEDELMRLKNDDSAINSSFSNIKNIAITLGSRENEIKQHIKIIKETIKKLKQNDSNLSFYFATEERFFNLINNSFSEIGNCHINASKEAMKWAVQNCDIGITKSGTNTLQFLVNLKPVVVYYKMHPFSYAIIESMCKVKYVNIINIMADKEIVPEFLQSRFTSENIYNSISELIPNFSQKKVEIRENFLKMLPNKDLMPSKMTSDVILSYLENDKD